MINWEKANTHAHVTSPNAGVLSTFEYDVRIGNAIKTKKKNTHWNDKLLFRI